MTEDNTATGEIERGERQQLQYLVGAAKEIESAVRCHNAGMMGAASARATMAETLLEDYRKAPSRHKEGMDTDQ